MNKSCQNRKYDGDFAVDTAYTQSRLKEALEAGEFIFHLAGSDIRVHVLLSDFYVRIFSSKYRYPFRLFPKRISSHGH